MGAAELCYIEEKQQNTWSRESGCGTQSKEKEVDNCRWRILSYEMHESVDGNKEKFLLMRNGAKMIHIGSRCRLDID